VAGLAAVRPDRRGIVHLDGVRRERGGVCTDRHEPRVKADLAACRIGGEHLARIGEAGLRDRVVLLVELKGNGVARLRGDIRGLEGQSGATNDDSVILRRGGGRSRGRSGSCA